MLYILDCVGDLFLYNIVTCHLSRGEVVNILYSTANSFEFADMGFGRIAFSLLPIISAIFRAQLFRTDKYKCFT